MPSSEECIEARNQVEEYFLQRMKEKFGTAAIEIAKRASYQEKLNLFAQDKKVWTGAHSPY